MDDVSVVKVSDCSDKLGEHAAQQRLGENVSMVGGEVEKIAAWIVAENQNGAGLIDIPSFQVHKRGVPNIFHDLKLALETHFDALLGCTAPGTVLADLDCNERTAVMFGWRRNVGMGAGAIFIRGRCCRLAGGKDDLAEGALAENPDGTPAAKLAVIAIIGLEILDVGRFADARGVAGSGTSHVARIGNTER